MRLFCLALCACTLPFAGFAAEPPTKEMEGRPNPPKTREEAIKRAEGYTERLKSMTDAEWEEKHKARMERRSKLREEHQKHDNSGSGMGHGGGEHNASGKAKPWHQLTPEERKQKRSELRERQKERKEQRKYGGDDMTGEPAERSAPQAEPAQ